METEEYLTEIVEKIKNDYAPNKIVLYGSYVWGKPNESSDLDLFIIKDTDNTRELARKIDAMLFPRSIPLDLVVFTPSYVAEKEKSRDPFILEIIESGKVLYDVAG